MQSPDQEGGVIIPIIYSHEYCPNCDKLKSSLQAAGVEFVERDMEAKMSLVDLRCRQCFTWEAPVLMNKDQVYESKDLFDDDGRMNHLVLALLLV